MKIIIDLVYGRSNGARYEAFDSGLSSLREDRWMKTDGKHFTRAQMAGALRYLKRKCGSRRRPTARQQTDVCTYVRVVG